MLEVDIPNSRAYLNRLIAASGIKIGSAKATAVAAIVELLDENTLSGLLRSIQEDYNSARGTIMRAETTRDNLRRLQEDYAEYKRSDDKLWEEIKALRAEKAQLEKEKERLEKENGLLEMLPAERSRVLAYEKALEIGMELLDENSTGAERAQVYRSASNVASGFVTKEDFKP